MSVLVRCPHCSRRLNASFTTDMHGHVHEHVEFCGCPKSRRLARICKYCDRPTDSVRSSYCGAEHRERGQQDASATYRRSTKGKAAQRRGNRKRRTASERAKRRLYDREHRAKPAVRERRKKNRRRVYLQKHDRYLEHRRLYRERHPERVREQQRAANAKRAQAKREHMHRYATKYVGPGRAPACADCNTKIPFDGRGRPMKKCRSCDPRRWQQADRRRARVAQPQERAA